MSFPTSSIGLPKEMDYTLPPSIPDSCRSYSVNISPDSTTSVVAPSQTAFFVASGANQPNFSAQNITFTIPSGFNDNVFMDCKQTTLSFVLTYTISTAASVPTTPFVNLISSAASFIENLSLYSNNVPIEQVGQYGLLSNYLLQNTTSLSERQGAMGVCMGCDTGTGTTASNPVNSATGIELLTTATSARYSFCIPLISVIGVNTEKYFPVGAVNNLMLQIQTPSLLPVCFFSGGLITTQPVFSTPFTLSEFSLNMSYTDIGDLAGSLLKQSLIDGRWLVKSATYTNSSITIPSGSSGSQQLLIQIRNTSCKSIFAQYGQSNAVLAQSNVSPNGYYDAIHIGCNSRQLQIGGNFYPTRPLNDVQKPAEAYPILLSALGSSLSTRGLGSSVSREMYNSIGGIASVPSNGDTFLVLPSAGSRGVPTGSDMNAHNVVKFPSGHFTGYNLERVSDALYSGVNTRSSPPMLMLNLQNALNATISVQCWGYSDVILAFDLGSKQVNAYI